MNLTNLAATLALSISVNAQAAETAIFCKNETSGTIHKVSPGTIDGDASCVADTIWGAKNVCFEGSAAILADRINQGDFVWLSEGYQMTRARVEGQVVVFTGVDQKSFFASENTLAPCATH